MQGLIAPALHAPGARGDPRGRLELSLHSLAQLFNSLDPSPFYERDLDPRAEAFLVSWAREVPRDLPLRLNVHLPEAPPEAEPEKLLTEAVHHHFRERARLTRADLHRLLREGRTSLAIGLAFLLACTLLSELAATSTAALLRDVLSQSLNIGGWVAMWRPLQVYLYDWWPLRKDARLFERMAAMPVRLRLPAHRPSVDFS